MVKNETGWKIYTPVEPCHIEILASLNLQTPELIKVLDSEKSIWNVMLDSIPQEIKNMLQATLKPGIRKRHDKSVFKTHCLQRHAGRTN